MSVITIDFETYWRKASKAAPAVSVVEQGNYAYTHDPEFEVLLVTVADGKETWAGEVKDFNWEALRGHRLIAHNAGFDRAVYRRLVEDGVAPAGLDVDWRCSADMASYVLGVRNLKDAMLRGFGSVISKAVRDDSGGLRAADLKARGKWKEFVEYGRGDAVNEWWLWDRFSPRWPDYEMALSDLTIRQRERGVRIDQDRLRAYTAALQEAQHVCESHLPWMARGRPPTSSTGVYEECRAVGIPCPPTKKEDEEGFLAWEARYRKDYPWVGLVGNHRSISKVLAGLEMLRERLRPDGRFEFDLLYFGGHTGRWSSGGFNMQNMRRTPLVVDMRTGAVVEWVDYKALPSKDGHTVVDVRSLFVPAEGHKFVDCDLSQIEPRVLYWLAKDHETLEAIRSGVSVYEHYARKAGRWTEPGPLKSGNLGLYTFSKIQVLQLGYQAGAERFRETALSEYGVVITPEQAEAAVTEYREANPKITGLWEQLDTAFRQSIGGDFVMELPSGRALTYRDVRRSVRTISVDSETKKVTKKWETTCKVPGKFGRVPSYGGKLTENLVQAVARDVFGLGMLRTEAAGIRTLWPIHDQIIAEVPEDRADEACKAVHEAMAWTPPWLEGCPVEAEAVVIERYTK